jgi:hypothetical protein
MTYIKLLCNAKTNAVLSNTVKNNLLLSMAGILPNRLTVFQFSKIYIFHILNVFIYLFNNDGTSSGYVVSNRRMIMDNELDRI